MKILQFAILEASSEAEAYKMANEWILSNQHRITSELETNDVYVYRDHSAENYLETENTSMAKQAPVWKVRINYYTSITKMMD